MALTLLVLALIWKVAILPRTNDLEREASRFGVGASRFKLV